MWRRRIRGAFGMGVTWAITWAIGGLMIGVASKLTPFLSWDWFFSVFDAPLPALAIPGFVAGALFSLVLGIAARGRSFREMSLTRFAAWGAAGGVLLTLFPLLLVLVGLASLSKPGSTPWSLVLAAGPFLIFMSTASSVITFLLARRAERVAALAEGASVDALGEGDARGGVSRPASEPIASRPSRRP